MFHLWLDTREYGRLSPQLTIPQIPPGPIDGIREDKWIEGVRAIGRVELEEACGMVVGHGFSVDFLPDLREIFTKRHSAP